MQAAGSGAYPLPAASIIVRLVVLLQQNKIRNFNLKDDFPYDKFFRDISDLIQMVRSDSGCRGIYGGNERFTFGIFYFFIIPVFASFGKT